MNRHRATPEGPSRRWIAHALAGTATAAGIAFVVLFGAWSPSGPLVDPFGRSTPASASATSSPCAPTSSAWADGRPWYGCASAFSPSAPPRTSTTTTTPTSSPSATSADETPSDAFLPPDPYATED